MDDAGSIFDLNSAKVALDDQIVLDGIDFHLRAGEFLALLGSNGSGKTTLVRAALGLVQVTSGRVRIYGLSIKSFSEWHRVGYVPQRSVSSATAASLMEVVLSGRIARSKRLRPYGRADRQAAEDALESVGLSEIRKRQVSQLSGGQHQRVLIARALAAEPDVLVLDEPVSGVDLENQTRLASLLGTFVARGGTVLLVAHALGAMEDLVSREVVLHAGQVSYEGPHQPDHVHLEHVHHPEVDPPHHTSIDRAVGG